MKIILLFLLLYSSINYCYSQTNNSPKLIQIEKELTDSIVTLKKHIIALENNLIISDSVNKEKIEALSLSLELTKKSIDDTRLRESLKSAEAALTKQNFLIDGYSYIIAGITILIAILTIGFSVLLAKSNQQAETAINRSNTASDRLNERMDYFDEKINNRLDTRFVEYEETKQEMETKEIYKYLRSKSPTLIKIAIEKLSLNLDKITFSNINDLIGIILSKILTEEEKTGLIDIMIQKNNSQVLSFLKTWDDVRIDNLKLKNTLFNYYITNNFYDFIGPVRHFILDYASPHLEFNNMIAKLTSHPEFVYYLLNYEPLIKQLTNYSKSEVRKFINKNSEYWNLDKEKINSSILFANNKK